MRRTWLFLLGGLFIHTLAFAQEEEVDLFELSLEELMNVEIVSASKKTENLFDAPVSSYTITRSEIAKSGVTSIPEALRLCPGVIVRETTNGNYDIHLRGFDNLLRYTESFVQANLLTLVMVDDRPVFNYNLGGTIWESLAIDLIDVERIEIVRGPAASLFGPNAVTGVINIITRSAKQEGMYYAANLQGGAPRALIGNAAFGYKFNEQVDFVVSGNYQQRERSDDLYYIYEPDQFVENTEGIILTDPTDTKILPNQSLIKYGVNGFLNYQPNEQVALTLTMGLQGAETQRLYYNFDASPLTNSAVNRQYISLNGSFRQLGVKLSHTRGKDDLYPGFRVITTEYDVGNTNLVVDYQWKVSNQLSIRPELSYQAFSIDDRDYTANSGEIGLSNGKISNSAVAGSLRADYAPIRGLRLIGALRADRFEVPNQIYLSYQLAATYKTANNRYLLRAVHARATSGAFLANYLLNVPPAPVLNTTNAADGSLVNDTIAYISYQGNTGIDVAQNTMTEVGVRVQASDVLQIDVALFQQRISDLSQPKFDISALSLAPDGKPVGVFRYQNESLSAIQRGVTLSANFVPHQRVHIKPFITFQKTKADSDQLSEDHESTPTFYGGASINFMAYRKLNLNASLYYYDQHTLYHREDLDRPTNVGQIEEKLISNMKITYQLVDKLSIYMNGRNLLGNDSREYYGTDRIGRSYWVGGSYNF